MTTTQITVEPNSSAASALRLLVFDLGVPLGSYYMLRKLGVDPCAGGGYRLAVSVPEPVSATREEVTA